MGRNFEDEFDKHNRRMEKIFKFNITITILVLLLTLAACGFSGYVIVKVLQFYGVLGG